MGQQILKERVAAAALERVADFADDTLVLGIGTGSTTECFIDILHKLKHRIDTTVSSSERSTQLLRENGFSVSDLNAVPRVDL